MSNAGYVPLQQLAAIVAAHRAEVGEGATVAFVLAPGGAAGAYQAGALQALAEAGVRPDLLIGSSSGALNALGAVLDVLSPLAPGPWPTTRLGRLWRRLGHHDVGGRAIVDKPRTLAWLGGKPGASPAMAAEVLGHLPTLAADWGALKVGLFRPDPLRRLLARAITGALGEPGGDPALAGHTLVDAWAARHRAGGRPPAMIAIATDVQSHQATAFVLGPPELGERLYQRRHVVRALGHGPLTGGAVVDALLASAAIPGAFPAVALPADHEGWPARRYVDGAIAMSEPFHLAIDAGATLVLSLEITPFARPPRPESGAGRHPVATAVDALIAIQERYLRADARGVAQWNWRLAGSTAPGRRVVPLFRLAPGRAAIGLLDFDGRWVHGKQDVSLFDWYMEGYGDAGGHEPAAWATYVRGKARHGDTGEALERRHGPGFWDATRRSAPGLESAPLAGNAH